MLAPNGIRAILFDFDGTLRFSQPRFFHVLYHYTVQAGFSASRDAHLAAMRWLHHYWAQSAEMVSDMERFGTEQGLFWLNHTRLFIRALGANDKIALQLAPEVQRRLDGEYTPTSIVSPQTIATLSMLKQAGFRLAVVSNRSQAFDDELATLSISRYFDLTVAAGVVNSWKPDRKIFLHSVKALGIFPEQAMYVGDNYYADIVGARQAGLRPVLVDDDGVFPEADCPTIRSVAEIEQVLA